jgi:hypothetical protein
LAKSPFAMPFEELRNGDARGCLDLLVQVHEPPAKLLRQTRANRALAGAHETGKTKDRSSRRRATRDESLTHDSGKRPLGTLQNSDCTTVGGEFDFGESLADGAEETVSPVPGMVSTVGIGSQELARLIVHSAGKRSRVHIQ